MTAGQVSQHIRSHEKFLFVKLWNDNTSLVRINKIENTFLTQNQAKNKGYNWVLNKSTARISRIHISVSTVSCDFAIK